VSLPRAARLQVAAVALSVLLYACLSHYGNTVAAARPLGAALAFAPFLLVAAGCLWRALHPVAGIAAAAAACLLLARFWDQALEHYSWAYLADECAIYGLLAWGFGRSLGEGRVPVCTSLADRVHGPLNAAEVRYTRRVTQAWTVFFSLITGATVTLFALAPLGVWSFFSNFCTVPLVLLMFAGEYAVRRRVLPQTADGGLAATLRVYFARAPSRS
jgi:uncharacterized membrane protein